MDEPVTSSPVEVRLTPAGTVALASALMSTVAGLIQLSGPIFSAGFTGLGILWLCRLCSSRHLAGIGITRSLPHRAQAGESFSVETRLTPGRGFRDGTTIQFTDPLASMKRDRSVTLTYSQETLLRYPGKSLQRGFFRTRDWTIHSIWPLGLFAVSRSGAFYDSNTLMLLPKPFLPSRLKSHLHRLVLDSTGNSLDPPEPAADFRLLREFRSGDPIRSIHWPSSLRSGQLHVSEVEPPLPKPRRYGILIHSYEPAGQVLTPETFEMILRIATGLLIRFQREEILLVFRHFPDRATGLSNRKSFESALDHLALCRRRRVPSLASLRDTGTDFRDCDEVFVLSDCPRSQWEESFREIFAKSTFIDATSLTSQSRPGLKTRHRLSS